MTDELKQEMTEKFNSAYGEEVKIGLREALCKVYINGCEHGYQYAIDKACEWLDKNIFEGNDYVGDPTIMTAFATCESCIADFRKAMEE